MFAQRLDLLLRDLQGEAARHLGFEHLAHGKDLARFLDRRRGDKSAARRLQRHQMVLGQLEQRLTNQGARDAKVVGQLLLGQLGAGQKLVLHNGAGERLGDGGR